MRVYGYEPIIIDRDRKLREQAKRLRQKQTKAEKYLWQFLRSKQLGYRFRRQHPLHGYITDFYCYELKLVIEVDGEIHSKQKDRDNSRDEKLRQYGYRTLRFSNERVLNSSDEVMSQIKKFINLPPE